MMVFEKIKTKRKHLYVAEQILKAIKEGFYKPGRKLPPERVLAKEMGVSRNSVREALSALQALSIVESKAGDGVYVKKSVVDINIESQILPILQQSESPFKIFEARSVLELGVIELVIANATSEDIERIDKALNRMRKYVDSRDYEGYLQANLEFHLATAEASKNPIVESTMAFLWETTNQRLLNKMLIDYWQEKIENSISIHEQIVSAIKDRNKELAHKAVYSHYEEPRDFLLGTMIEEGSSM